MGNLILLFRQLPRRLIGQILVGLIGQCHHLAHGSLVIARLVVIGDGFLLCIGLLIELFIRQHRPKHAVIELVDKAGAAAGDVDQLADQISIDALAEIFQLQINVAQSAAQPGGEIVAQVISVQMIEIGTRHDEGTARFRHLGTVDGKKAVCEYGAGNAIAAAVQHCRPEQGVEINDVLADKVVQLGVAAGTPPVIEIQFRFIGTEIGKAGHVAHRRIQPDVKKLVLLAGYFKAEVGRIAGHVPTAQAVSKPLLQLVAHFVLQAGRLHPLLQHVGEIGQTHEKVLGFAQHRCAVAQGRHRINQVGGVISGATHLATVAVLVLGAAFGTLAANEAIRQKHLFFSVIALLDGMAFDMTLGLQTGPDVVDDGFIAVAVGGTEMIIGQAEIAEIALMFCGHFGDQLMRRDATFLRVQHDRRAVGIIGPYEIGFMAARTLVSGPDVGLDVLHHVTQMNRAIGIGQGSGNKNTALFHGFIMA